MRKIRIIGLLSLSILANWCMAQPGGNIGQFEMKITDKYKATVGEAIKVNDQPSFEDTTTRKLNVQYRIVSQPLVIRYEPEPISPARISRVPVEQVPKGMIKAGFGAYRTPLIEAYWNSGRSSKQSYGFWGKHYSSFRGVKETVYDDNQLAQSSLGGFYNRYYKDFTWGSEIYGNWDKYTYYGVDGFTDSLSYDEDVPRKAPYNVYSQYGIKTSILGKQKKNLGWLDELGLDFYNLSDRYDGKENFVKLNSDWQMPAGDLDLDMDVNLTYFQNSFDSIVHGNQTYFTLQAKPSVKVVIRKMLFDFGLNLYYNRYAGDFASTQSDLIFFPEVRLRLPIVEDVLGFYAGAKGELQHNSFRHITHVNPYVVPGDTLVPTRNLDMYLGLVGILSSNASFNVRGGIMYQKDLALFYRNPMYQYYLDSTSIPPIDVRFDNVMRFYARGELGINISNNLHTTIFGELRGFNTNTQLKAWYLPTFLAGMDVNYTLKEKLKMGAELNYVGKRQAFKQELNPEIDAELPGYLDVSVDLEYLYNSRLSAFVGMSNLFNSHYDLYLGYKAQSINFMMGFTYKL